MADYYLNVFDTAGDLQYVITDFSSLHYVRRVNAPGLLQISLRGDHPLLGSLADKWQVEVWRKPDGGTFARDFVGLARQEEFYHGQGGSKGVVTCPGLMSLLSWRIVAYYAGTADKTKFTSDPAETVMNTLVKYNATTDATVVNGRLRAGAITGLTVETDGAGGNTVDWFCAYENLLETLQKLAQIAGGDFDVVKTSATAWQWRYYDGQLGTDRTASVIFALERGNMGSPQWHDIRVDEKTVCIVGGQGQDSSRTTVIRTGTNYDVDDNNIEVFLNATDVDTTAGLNARGDMALDEQQAQQQFEFDVIQTPGTLYGTHYTLGDLVTAVNPFTGASVALKVEEVQITVDENGKETIDVQMGHAAATDAVRMLAERVVTAEKRLRELERRE